MFIIGTKVFFVEERKVLLAPRKNGGWNGFWDGYGGKLDGADKVHAADPIKAAAAREVEEESTATVRVEDLEMAALVRTFRNKLPRFELHVFLARRWSGVPKETKDEGIPRWFPFDALPKKIRPGDREWIVRVLNGETFEARLRFGPHHTLLGPPSFRPAKFL